MAATKVAIAIVIRDAQVLIARRPATAELGGYWEYPGGKCNDGEDPRQCVVREVREETGLSVQPIRAIEPIDWQYPGTAVRLYPFVCTVLAGEARAYCADEIRWVSAAELSSVHSPPANVALNKKVIEWLVAEGHAPPSPRPL